MHQSLRYGVFVGTNRPSPSTKIGDIVKINIYEQLCNHFHQLEVEIDYIEFLPDAISYKGSTDVEGTPYKVNLHLSTRSPGNDTVRFYAA